MVKLVGILNITPDSFSDGGRYITEDDILNHCNKLIADGADIIDIGAESTRPNSITITSTTEWQRLEPILAKIIKLAKKHHILTSLDTYHLENAALAIELGIDFINDVTGFNNLKMVELAAASSSNFIVMHNLGIPARSDIHLDEKLNPIDILNQWIGDIIKITKQYSIDPNRIIIDPGIGFGKTAKQSILILQQLDLINKQAFKILVGHSRKSFLKSLYPNISEIRDIETLDVSKLLVSKGVDFLRVHDIELHKKRLGI